MRIIKKIEDIELLWVASVVKDEVLQKIEDQFKNIYNDLGDGIPIEEFSLTTSGIIVLLEAGDNVKDLSEIGLNPEEDGLLGATPEWVEEQELEECTLIYICILCNNEYALSIFLERGKLGPKMDDWINDNK